MARRRGAGEGSIYRRGDGRWAATFTVGVDATGRRRRKTVYAKTQQEVLRKYRQAQKEHAEGVLPERVSDLTVARYLKYWLESVVAREDRPNTLRIYRQAVERVLPIIGGRRLQGLRRTHMEALFRNLATTARAELAEQVLAGRDLTPEDRQRRLHRLRADKHGGEPLSVSTIRTIRTALGRAFDHAVREGLLAMNPVRDAAMPKATVKPRRNDYPSVEGLRRFLAAVEGDRFQAFWLLAVYTGARHGELLALRWEHLDLEKGQMRIEGTWDEKSGTCGPPKSSSGFRQIPIARDVVEALRAHRTALAALPHPRQFVFAGDAAGRPVHPTTTRAHFKAILRRAGLPDSTRVHDLRHAAATALANSNAVPLTVARDQLGHSSVRMTERYVHPDADAQRRAAETLADVLRGRRVG